MRDEIACLREQVNTLISCSERKISNNSDLNLSSFKDLCLTNNRTSSSVRRASSFHGKDFVDNSSYFDKKVNDLKKANSHQNVILNNDCLQKDKINVEGSDEKITWKDAEKYFKSSRVNTPAPQTGRASVAKLRAQNAGMVLAKAKLFDECTTKTSEFVSTSASSKKHSRDKADKPSPKIVKEINTNTEKFKRQQSLKRSPAFKKQSNKNLRNKNCNIIVSSSSTSPQTKTRATVVSPKPLQESTDKNCHSAQTSELRKKKLSDKDPIIHQISVKDKAINIIRDMEMNQKENITDAKVSPLKRTSNDTAPQNSNICSYKSDVGSKTPHIKRPLTVKTPNSKSLMRRPPVETRRTPLRATAQLGTPRRQSPRSILKTRNLSTMHITDAQSVK